MPGCESWKFWKDVTSNFFPNWKLLMWIVLLVITSLVDTFQLTYMLIFFVDQWNSWPKNHTAASFLFCMTVWKEKPIMFVFQKRRETFQQDDIPITLP